MLGCSHGVIVPDQQVHQRAGGQEPSARGTSLEDLSAGRILPSFCRLTGTLLSKEQSGIVEAMASVRITAKRQATLPAALCQELGVGPGDKLVTERRVIRGETVLVLRPRRPDWSWLGAARGYATGKSHRWRDIRRSMAKGWAANVRP